MKTEELRELAKEILKKTLGDWWQEYIEHPSTPLLDVDDVIEAMLSFHFLAHPSSGLTEEKIIEVLNKYTQLMGMTKAGEARLGISSQDYNLIAFELLALHSPALTDKEILEEAKAYYRTLSAAVGVEWPVSDFIAGAKFARQRLTKKE